MGKRNPKGNNITAKKADWSPEERAALIKQVTNAKDVFCGLVARSFCFCETVTASSSSRWHIRKLTANGQKFTGGADSPSLCGRTVAWDLNVQITKHHISHACVDCVERFAAIANENTEYTQRKQDNGKPPHER